jgi:hypothetical protein
MHRARILLLGLGALVSGAAASTPPADVTRCTAPEHRQLDFWLGEWEVFENGSPVGTNRIESILDGCALQEHWSGAAGTRGTSLNMYSPRDRKWHQTWVDSGGLLLELAGELREGRMVLAGHALSPDGQRVLHEIAWERLPDGTVRQHWRASRDQGASWKDVFVGVYRRAKQATAGGR